MRTGSRSPTRPPFIEAPLPRSGATAAPVAVSNETVLHRGVEPYCNDFTHKRRGLQRDRRSSRPGQGPLQVVLGRVAVSNETALHRGTTSRWDVAKWDTGRGLQRDRPSSRPAHGRPRGQVGRSRSPTRPPFIEARRSRRRPGTRRGRGLQRDRPSSRPVRAGHRAGAGLQVAVSNETALHRGNIARDVRDLETGRGLQRDRPSSRPHDRGGGDGQDAGRGLQRDRPSSRLGQARQAGEEPWSRSPTRPPFIEAWPRSSTPAAPTRRGLQRDRPSSRHASTCYRPARRTGRGLQRDRPSSRRVQWVALFLVRLVAVSNETALHRGRRVVPGRQHTGEVAVSNETALHRGSADTWLSEYLVPVAVSNETALHRGPVETLLPDEVAQSRSPTRPPFIEADQRLLYPGQPASRGLQRDRPSSRLAARPGPPALGEVAVSDETALHRGLYRPGRRHRGRLVAVSDETALHRGSLYGYCGPGARSVAVSDETALHRGSGDGSNVTIRHNVAVSDETALHRGPPVGGGWFRWARVAVSDETALHRGRFLPSGW